MKNLFKIGMLALAVSLYSCGGDSTDVVVDDAPSNPNNPNTEASTESAADAPADVPPSERIDLVNKGVGTVTDAGVDLDAPIDDAMAAHGKEVYDINCTACHKVDARLVGPAPKGILERRTPEWVMNMIMDPELMVKEDPLARDLLMEFNGSPMSNQGISEEEARAIVEYFRTL